METAFMIICWVAAIGVGFMISWAIGKIDKDDKIPEWLVAVIGIGLIFGGVYAAGWFYDAYREHVLEQEHSRQHDNCERHAKTEEQCQFFWDMLNED